MMDNTATCEAWHLIYMWSENWTLCFSPPSGLGFIRAARGPEGGIDGGNDRLCEGNYGSRRKFLRAPENNFNDNFLLKMSLA